MTEVTRVRGDSSKNKKRPEEKSSGSFLFF